MNRLQSLTSRSSWLGLESVNIGGSTYPLFGLNQTQPGGKIEDIDVGYTSLVYRAYMSNPIVFACMRARLMLFTEARFQFQTLRGGRPGDYFGNESLRILETPWPGAMTGDLLKYMIADADLAGNAFILRRANQLKRLRPDWTRIIHGSRDPQGSMWAPDAELLGYAYQEGGSGAGKDWTFFEPNEVAHFSPIPDPLMPVRGMSWLSPILRDIMGDEAMTEHKLRFHENGGTPNLALTTGYTDVAKLNEFMLNFRQNFTGSRNAYKAFGMTLGMDAKVIGADLQQLDFKVVQGAGETRIAAAAGVPAAVVGISEGLQGSALNSGNFGMAMRNFADLTMRPLWRNAAGSLERIIPAPTGARLWYDDRDIPALKDDIKDAATVAQMNGATIGGYIKDGFEPDSAVDAVVSGDPKRLRHTGLVSVQLQTPGETPPEPAPKQLAPGPGATIIAKPVGRSAEELVAESESRVYRAMQLAQAPVRFEEGAIHVEVHAPEPAAAPQVTFEEGAITVEAPPPAEVTVELPPAPGVTVHVEAAHAPMTTVIDRDPVTGKVTGSHEVPVDGD